MSFFGGERCSGKKRGYLLQCVIILAWGQKALFLLLLKTFLFVIVGSENAQRRTIRGRCRAINLDSFLICKTPTSCSMDAPSRWIFQYKPHYPITESSYHNDLSQCKIYKNINWNRWNFSSVSFNRPKVFFDASVQSWDEESFKTLQLAGKSEELGCNQSKSFCETASLMEASHCILTHQPVPCCTSVVYHGIPVAYIYSCILYHNMSKKILWQTISKYSQNVLKYNGIVARHTFSMHFRNYVFNVTPR